MRTKRATPRGLTAALVGVLSIMIFASGAPAPAAAQQTPSPNPAAKTIASKPGDKTAARAAAKSTTKSTTKSAVSRNPAASAWTINDALENGNSHAVANSDSAPGLNSPFSRIQLDTGSVGLDAARQVQDGRFSDGRPVPGLETEKRNAPTYFGLSLSVPTTDKSIIPIPLLPRPE